MAKFMKLLNNISRSQAIYRKREISVEDLQGAHYAFTLAICREPGRSQDELARELCINKSTAARNLSYLEDRGYVKRVPLENDKRQFSVYPTERMLAILPTIRSTSQKWMELISDGISDVELSVFNSVLERMHKRAREITLGGEDEK